MSASLAEHAFELLKHEVTDFLTVEAWRHKQAEFVSAHGNEAVASARHSCAQGGYVEEVASELGAVAISVGIEDVPAPDMAC